jgi:hypothetical protein
MSTTKLDLVGIAEVAAIAGESRSKIRVWRVRGHLPPPITELACGPIWHKQDIVKWAREFRPHPHPKTRKAFRNADPLEAT